MATLATLFIRVLADTAAAQKQLNSLGGTMTSAGSKMMGAGRKLTTFVTAPLVGAGVAALKMSNDFHQGMANVNSILQVSDEQLGKYSDQVIALSQRFPQDAKTLATGLYDVASGGFKGADAMKVLEASAGAASAGMTTTDVATKAIVSSLKAYGLSAKDAGAVSDTLFKGVDKGIMTFEDLASSMGDYVGIASQLKVPLEDVVAAQAAMTLSGSSAFEAATSVNAILRSLIKPSGDMTDQLKEFGFAGGQAALETLGLQGVMVKLSEAVGDDKAQWLKLFPEIRAARGAMALAAGDGKNFADVMAGMGIKVGATGRALREQAKGPAYQLTIAWNKIKAAIIDFGEILLPVAKKLADFAQSAAKWFQDLSKPQKELVVKLIAVAAAAGPLLLIFGGLFKVFGGILKIGGGVAGIFAKIGGAAATAGAQTTAAGAATTTAATSVKTPLITWQVGLTSVALAATAAYRAHKGLLAQDIAGHFVKSSSGARLLAIASVEVGEGQKALIRILRDVTGLTAGQELKIATLVEKLHKWGGALTANQRAMVNNLLKVGDYGGALKLLRGILEGTIGPLEKNRKGINDAKGAAADAEQKVKAFGRAVRDIPAGKTTKITADTSAAMARLQALQDKYRSIKNEIEGTIHVAVTGGNLPNINVPKPTTRGGGGGGGGGGSAGSPQQFRTGSMTVINTNVNAGPSAFEIERISVQGLRKALARKRRL